MIDREKSPQELLAEVEDPEVAREVLEVLGPVVKGRAWPMMKELWGKQIEARRTAVVFQPLGESPNAVYVQEYMKGEIAAIQAMSQLIEGVYQLALELKTEADQVKEEEHGDPGSTEA